MSSPSGSASTGAHVIVGAVGALTPVGATAPASAAAVRARISGFAEHDFLLDGSYEPMIVAAVPLLDQEQKGPERFLELAAPALREAAGPLRKTLPAAPVPLLVGLPGGRPGLPAKLSEHIVDGLTREAAATIPLAQVEVIEGDSTAGLAAIQRACAGIRAGRWDVCVAGGVDSYLEPETLEWLDAQGLLRSPRARWGFTPGEAACFCLLASPDAATRLGLQEVLRVGGVATAADETRAGSDTPCTGQALTRAVRACLEGEETRIHQILCDLNGERARVDELGFLLSRISPLLDDPRSFMTPADVWGDVGAATGPLLLMLAASACARGYARGPNSLLYASSREGERCAALVRAEVRPRE